MPDTGHGGPREGTPGKKYPNRSDLTIPSETGPSRRYGDRKAQQDAIRSANESISLARPAAPTPPSPAFRVPPPFDRPTERPSEPVTAGLSTGAGPGPSDPFRARSTLAELRALYEAFPSRELREMILDEMDRLS